MTTPHGSCRRVEESTAGDDDLNSLRREIIHTTHLKTMHHRFLGMRCILKYERSFDFYRAETR